MTAHYWPRSVPANQVRSPGGTFCTQSWLRRGWRAYIVGLLLLPALAIELPARWLGNDDALMGAMSNGTYDGSPNALLSFIGPVWSVPAAWIQEFAQFVSVLPLLMTISVAAGCALVLAQLRMNPARVLAAALFPFLVLGAGVFPSFTITAFLVSSLGAASLVLSVFVRPSRLASLAGTVLIVLGWQWRQEATIAVLLVFIVPVVFYQRTLKVRYAAMRWPWLLAPFAAITTIQVGLALLAHRVADLAAWQAFLALNHDRAIWYDTSMGRLFPAIAPQFGIQPAEIQAFLSMNALTTPTFDAASMAELKLAAPHLVLVIGAIGETLGRLSDYFSSTLITVWLPLLVLVIAAVAILVKVTAAWIIGQVLLVGLVVLALETYRHSGSFITGLGLSTALAVLTIMAGSGVAREDDAGISAARKLTLTASVVALVALGSLGLSGLINSNATANARDTESLDIIGRLAGSCGTSPQEQIRLVAVGGALGSLTEGQPYSPAIHTKAYERGLSSGWTNLSPPQVEKMSKWGISDAYDALIHGSESTFTDTCTLLLGSSYASDLTQLVLQERVSSGTLVEKELVASTPSGFGVYRFTVNGVN